MRINIGTEPESPETATVIGQIVAMVRDPNFLLNCLATIKKLPPELLLAFPTAALAIPNVQDEKSDDEARKYLTVAATSLLNRSSEMGILQSVILGRRMVRNLDEGNKLEALRDLAISFRPALTSAASMAIIVDALQSLPQQEAFNYAAKFIGIPDLNNAVLTGAIIGGIAAELCFVTGMAIETRFAQSGRNQIRLIAERAAAGSRNCLIGMMGDENVAQMVERINRMSNDTMARILETALASSALIGGTSDIGNDGFDKTKKWTSISVASFVGSEACTRNVLSGMEAVRNLGIDKEAVINEVGKSFIMSALAASSMAIIASVLDSIPQQKAFDAAAEFAGLPDVENPALKAAMLAGIAAELCFMIGVTIEGLNTIRRPNVLRGLANSAQEYAYLVGEHAWVGANLAIAGITSLFAQSNRVAPAPESDRVAVADSSNQSRYEGILTCPIAGITSLFAQSDRVAPAPDRDLETSANQFLYNSNPIAQSYGITPDRNSKADFTTQSSDADTSIKNPTVNLVTIKKEKEESDLDGEGNSKTSSVKSASAENVVAINKDNSAVI